MNITLGNTVVESCESRYSLSPETTDILTLYLGVNKVIIKCTPDGWQIQHTNNVAHVQIAHNHKDAFDDR